jgi:penicillin-binding protein 2
MDILRGGNQPWRSEKRRPDHAFLSGQNLFLIQGLIFVLFGILTIQLVRMQIFEADSYENKAANNRLRELQVLPLRGLIYDRNGTPLVQNVANFAAVITPADLPDDEEDVFSRLSVVLNMPSQEIADKVAAKRGDGNPYEAVVIKDELDRDTALVLKELTPNLPGAELRVEARRSYPSGDLTSDIVGYVGSISEEEYASLRPRGYILSDQVGKAGIEADYESVLRGKPGQELAEVDASGRQLDVVDARAAQPGQSVFLTIDLELQRQATEALREYMGTSDNATAVVMDVHSGEILAMVSLPSYDNNIFSRAITQQELDDLLSQPGKPLVNHAIAEMYAPGSTFKTITGLAALQEGVATTGTVITSKGYITVENEYDPNVVYYFRDWAVLGALDFYRGVAMSSDVYFYYLAGGKADEGFRGLGEERLARYARSFGLGEPTGVDLPGESPGLVPDAQWKERNWGEAWYLGDTYSFGIGQGYLAVTPLQLVNEVAAIANGGDLLRPRLIKETKDDHGNTVASFGPEVRRQLPVESDYLAVMREAMRQSVDYGVASNAKVAGVTVAGKTGSAEFGEQHADGSYDTHAWFVGFAPFEDPQIAVVVFLDRAGAASQSAAPAAARIFDYYFNQRYVTQPEGQSEASP